MIISFLGPEGSGKGTQAQIVAQENSLPHIITGEMLRARKDEDSKTGELIRATFAAGGYLPDDAISEIFLERIKQADCENGFVSDGFPRSISQAKALDTFLATKQQKVDAVILLQISEDETVNRLSKRGRFDDTPEKIKGRLQSYHERVDALVAHYKDLGVVHEVNGEQSIETIAEEIKTVVEGLHE